MSTALPPPTDGAGLVTLHRDECIRLLSATPIGRMAFNDGDQLTVLPVAFDWVDDGVVFRTLDGAKMEAAVANERVAFEIDGWDQKSRTGWSVLVRGVARAVTEWAEAEQLERSGGMVWAKERWRDRWIRIDPDEVTGRKLA
jgi:nitroimidazol reductase NimA-like FMN-containing flavoprotein (pyridoxamine 5'-phosphate oxidase superfamily)